MGKTYCGAIRSWQRGATFSEEVSCVGPMVSSDAARLLKLKEEISLLEARMGELLPRFAETSLLSAIPGFSFILACELAGEMGSFSRFSGEASLAIFLGMCPLDHQSGSWRGTRVPRQVNKRAKVTMMAASWHNSRMVSRSGSYYQRKRSEGRGHNQAVRSLGRHLVRVIWSMQKEGRVYEVRH